MSYILGFCLYMLCNQIWRGSFMRFSMKKYIQFFLLLGMMFMIVVTGCGFQGESDQQLIPPVVATPSSNMIIRENALQGTDSFEIPDREGASVQIQAYASATSVQAGQSLTFYVSTQQEGTHYSVNIYRLGW